MQVDSITLMLDRPFGVASQTSSKIYPVEHFSFPERMPAMLERIDENCSFSHPSRLFSGSLHGVSSIAQSRGLQSPRLRVRILHAVPIFLRKGNQPSRRRPGTGCRWQRYDSPLTSPKPGVDKTSSKAVRGMACARVAPTVLSPPRTFGITDRGQDEIQPRDGSKNRRSLDALQPTPNTPGFAVHDRPSTDMASGT